MNNISLGKLIKVLRKKQNMSQEDLASILGVTTSAVSKWETGKNMPDMDMLHKLCVHFNISLDEIYNPETTLSRITSDSLQNTNSAVSAPEKSSIETNIEIKPKRTFHKYKCAIFIIAFLLITVTIGFIAYFFTASDNELNIRPIAFRTVKDEQCGTVYEMACVYKGNLETLTLEDPYIMQLSEDWINDETVQKDIIIMKVSFYLSEEEAAQWVTPQKTIYLVR